MNRCLAKLTRTRASNSGSCGTRCVEDVTTAHTTELLIDCEEDRTLRAVLVGMLRETDRSVPRTIASEPARDGEPIGGVPLKEPG
jgi:hypothetical protein